MLLDHVPSGDNIVELFLPGLVLHGIACGVVFASVNVGGVSGNIEERHQGVAASLIVAAYASGTGVGAAAMATVITATTHGSGPVALLHAYQKAFLVASFIAVFGLLVSITSMPGLQKLGRQAVVQPATEGEAAVAAG